MIVKEDFVFASRYLKEGGSDDDDWITFVGNKFFFFLEKFYLVLKYPIFYTPILLAEL